jgi:hypothetical protein
MTLQWRLASLLAMFAALPACVGGVSLGGQTDSGSPADGGSNTDGGLLETGAACTTSTDCGPHEVCGFLDTVACQAQGQCFPMGAQCNHFNPGCACDDTLINVDCNGLPFGYTPKPLLHAGACVGAADGGTCSGSDAGSTGVACTTSANCAANEVCGFLESASCQAQGQCFPQGVQCNCFSPGCACDGTTTVNIACNGLPDGYALQPISHSGMCLAGDGGSAMCGTQTCTAAEYCSYQPPGIDAGSPDGGPPPDYHTCQPLPAVCTSMPTCACVVPLLPASCLNPMCSEAAGAVSVTCMSQ